MLTTADTARPLTLATLTAIVSALLACGDDATSSRTAVASVSLSAAAFTFSAGSTVQFEATLRDADDNELSGRTIAWSSSDPAVATVDNTGLVTGVAEGPAIITATSEGQLGTANITVTPATVAFVIVSPANTGVAAGGTVQLTATLRDALGRTLEGRTVTWSSSDLTVATVIATGLVSGVSPGDAIITAESDGQSGTANVTVPPPPTFASVDGGATHTCGVTPGGLAYCWGRGAEGQLGDGVGSNSTMPVVVSGGLTFTAIVAGGEHTCGLATGGIAYCWGANLAGQLGNAESGGLMGETSPVAVFGDITFSSLTIGTLHSCALTPLGVAYCWGDNNSGQLGDGSTTNRDTPSQVSGGLTFSELNAGGLHTCGITTDSLAYCWGRNNHGQLGTGATPDVNTPTAVTGGRKFVSVSAGPEHTCALTAAGAAHCWGRNSRGQLGNGAMTSQSTPVLVAGGLVFRSVSAGGFAHTCGVTTGNVAYCWGWGDSGQLGNGSTSDSSVPKPVVGGLVFASVNGGSFHSCGVTTGDIAYCWGGNSFGQLGEGSTADRTTPVRVAGQP